MSTTHGIVYLSLPLYSHEVCVAYSTDDGGRTLHHISLKPSREDGNQELMFWRDYREYFEREKQIEMVKLIKLAIAKGRTTPKRGTTYA